MKKDRIQLALIYGFIVPILIVLLLIVVARSNDDRVKEEQRRSEMTKIIGDEN